MKIAHILNPVKVTEESDLFIAQPITFETMRQAKYFAQKSGLNIELYYTCFKGDLEVAPHGFNQSTLLERSVLNTGYFDKKRHLPVLKDILDSLYDATDADYLIYTNVDIALMPHFYVAIARLIERGLDAFVINRRTVSDLYTGKNDIPLMCSEVGGLHPGFDCFIYKRHDYSSYILQNTCIGINWVGAILMWNLQVFSEKFEIFKDLHLTFHLGNDKTWKNPKFEDYVSHNKREAKEIYSKLKQQDSDFKDEKLWKILND